MVQLAQKLITLSKCGRRISSLSVASQLIESFVSHSAQYVCRFASSPIAINLVLHSLVRMP